MTRRIRNWDRKHLLDDLLLHRFTEEAKDLVRARAAFAEAVYLDVFSIRDREKMMSVPKGWLPQTERIYVKFGEGQSNYHGLYFSGLGAMNTDIIGVLPYDWRTEQERRFTIPYDQKDGCSKVYDVGHPLARQMEDLSATSADLKKLIADTKQQVSASLSTFTTFGKLVEEWPEVEPFLKGIAEVPRNLPALPRKKLNQTLGLPVPEVKVA